jgi:hypothetical protein
MSAKRKRNLVSGQRRIGRTGSMTCIICSIMRAGYEPHKPMSDKMLVAKQQDVMA